MVVVDHAVRKIKKCDTWLVSLLLTMSLVSNAAATSAQLTAEGRLLNEVTTKVILTGHERLRDNIQHLAAKAKSFCDGNKVSFNEVKTAWLEAMVAWSALKPIDFGPIDDTNVGFRFQFWPDPLNLVHRKFRSRIKGANKAIHAASLADAGAAIQGLSAIEYLLYDSKVGGETAYQSQPHLCDMLIGTISNLHDHAIELLQLWQSEYAPLWTVKPGQTIEAEQVKRRVEHVFSGMVMALSEIRDLKLGKALSIESPQAMENGLSKNLPLRPWLLESWRSQTSLKQIQSTLLASQHLYDMQYGFGDYLLAVSGANSLLDQRIKDQFAAILATLDKNQASAFSRMQQKESRDLALLYTQIHDLTLLLKIEYTRATNIHFRFNAKDGD